MSHQSNAVHAMIQLGFANNAPVDYGIFTGTLKALCTKLKDLQADINYEGKPINCTGITISNQPAIKVSTSSTFYHLAILKTSNHA